MSETHTETKAIAHAECLVIGGGVIGSSIAYHVAKEGRSTIMLERWIPGEGASGAAVGMLAAESEEFTDLELARFARASRDAFPELVSDLERLSGISVQFRTEGFVTPFRSEAEGQKRWNAAKMREDDCPVWWDAKELARRIPGLADQVIGAIYRSKETQVAPVQLCRAYAGAAAVLGATIWSGTQAEELVIQDGRVCGARTDIGFFSCDQVVIAAGLDSLKLLEQIGFDYPLYPVKGEAVAVSLKDHPLDYTIYADDVYLVPKQNNELWIGATSLPHQYDKEVTAGGLKGLLERASFWLPRVHEASFIRAWAGLRPQAAAERPFIGPVPGVEGAYAAVGHYRNGVLLSDATGRAMAAMLKGADVAELGISKFSSELLKEESL
ncbi:glycine oxidase ThiO [Paenibacillus sp. CMAA1739]|uniref:glycine oxidase ThiO n=1 Tax=Paenibacillus ottowii TaxID=2315729 RepID=UPI002730465D|nr:MULTISPECIES: glycine oxidase ThiO [Paenibacillus]MDP1513003.1 glycine oxidase ThiO [Paenibacillus ottowii]MEC4569012.1 glycine oxidase ThiO [Paenibacillus sp. CMAA1739]